MLTRNSVKAPPSAGTDLNGAASRRAACRVTRETGFRRERRPRQRPLSAYHAHSLRYRACHPNLDTKACGWRGFFSSGNYSCSTLAAAFGKEACSDSSFAQSSDTGTSLCPPPGMEMNSEREEACANFRPCSMGIMSSAVP